MHGCHNPPGGSTHLAQGDMISFAGQRTYLGILGLAFGMMETIILAITKRATFFQVDIHSYDAGRPIRCRQCIQGVKRVVQSALAFEIPLKYAAVVPEGSHFQLIFQYVIS